MLSSTVFARIFRLTQVQTISEVIVMTKPDSKRSGNRSTKGTENSKPKLQGKEKFNREASPFILSEDTRVVYSEEVNPHDG